MRKSQQVSYGQFLFLSIIGFVMLTMVIVIERVPYRLGWGDSANRMFTHILPIALFCIALRVDSFFRAESP